MAASTIRGLTIESLRREAAANCCAGDGTLRVREFPLTRTASPDNSFNLAGLHLGCRDKLP
jgi:hypothetical protein